MASPLPGPMLMQEFPKDLSQDGLSPNAELFADDILFAIFSCTRYRHICY